MTESLRRSTEQLHSMRKTIACQPGHVTYRLGDNGYWKTRDSAKEHYGRTNTERRCQKNAFGFILHRPATGTRIEITVPVHYLINASWKNGLP